MYTNINLLTFVALYGLHIPKRDAVNAVCHRILIVPTNLYFTEIWAKENVVSSRQGKAMFIYFKT